MTPAPIACIAYAPDGTRIAAGNQGGGAGNKELRVWDVATGEELAILRGHAGVVSSVAFSPDGRSVASGGIDSQRLPTSFRDPQAAIHAMLKSLQACS